LEQLPNPVKKLNAFIYITYLYTIFPTNIKNSKERLYINKMMDYFNNKATKIDEKKIKVIWLVVSTGLFNFSNKTQRNYIYSTSITSLKSVPSNLFFKENDVNTEGDISSNPFSDETESDFFLEKISDYSDPEDVNDFSLFIESDESEM
jgi:hypothetical protein